MEYEAGYIFAKPGQYTNVDMRDKTSFFPSIGEEMYSHFSAVGGGPRLKWVAITSLIWNNNNLYLRFPKKGKRKLARSVRRHNKKWKCKIDPIYLIPNEVKAKVFGKPFVEWQDKLGITHKHQQLLPWEENNHGQEA